MKLLYKLNKHTLPSIFEQPSVLQVGVPFPAIKDMQVDLKMKYNDTWQRRGLLNGRDWYQIQAFRWGRFERREVLFISG